jgi:transcriptional regulator with XRE-family HTH domain
LNPQSIDAIGKRLRMLRQVLGHTQEEMAISIGSGSGAQMWANYEAGYRRIGTDHALALCQRFGLTMDWVYRGNPGMCDPALMARIRSQEISEARGSKEEDQAC